MPAIDFSEVKGLEPVPEDTYICEISHAEEDVSQKGNEVIRLRWKVLSGEYAGRIIFDTLTFSDNSLWRVKNTLMALGYKEKFKGSVEPEDLLGLVAEITVSIQQSSGTNPTTGEPYPERNNVIKVAPASVTAEDLM